MKREEMVVTDATASAPIPGQVHDILTDKPTGFVATIRPDGMLSVTPVALMFDGEYVRFSITKDRKKYRNLRGDDRGMIGMFSTSQSVSLLIVPLAIVMLLVLSRRWSPTPRADARRARAA